ncbi:MAG: hypothetical protein JWN41_1139 [Thermoleophilia bacterium]|nr:hypothetical protein [Thermoleophilia bacterium]
MSRRSRERQQVAYSGDIHASASARNRGRARRRRRRFVLGATKVIFWALVLVGVFVLGIGFGRTVSTDDHATKRSVTLAVDANEPVQATLPIKTVTVVRTVTTPRKTSRKAAVRATAGTTSVQPH